MDIPLNDSPKPKPARKQINLALQGGGSHGAFTWGVLDRLLEDPTIEIDGISGTSAGAVNAVVLAAGIAKDGREGGRAALNRLWNLISEAGRYSMLQPAPWTGGNHKMETSPSFVFFDMLTRVFSPYDFNPMNYHPLEKLLAPLIDWDVVRHADAVKLFIAATNVRSGKARIFRNREMSIEVLLASSGLPLVFQATEIDGEAYYDGGYMGNPCIYPLIYSCESRDVVVVQINPMHRDEVPKSARDIMDRINEISFNSSLLHEMRSIQFVTRLIDSGALDNTRYKRMNMHMIEAEDELKHFGAASKFNTDMKFLRHLHDIGRRAADGWLKENYDNIG